MASQGTVWIAPGNLQRWRAEAIMLDSKAEQRGLRRYAIRMQVTVRWSYNKTGGTVLGLVRDISEDGVFLFLDSQVPEGANIEFMLSLPPEIAGDTQSAFWCKGRVVRVEAPLGAKSGIGARIEERKKVPKDKTYEVRSVSSSDSPLGGLAGTMASASNKTPGRQSQPAKAKQYHHSEAGAMFFAALIVLVAGLLLSVFLPVPAADTQILQLPVTVDPTARVWVHTRTGQYYCKDASEFGKLEPGKFMSQHDAQAAYFRAASGVCQ